MDLAGTLPKNLGSLEKLRALIANKNGITGQVVSVFHITCCRVHQLGAYLVGRQAFKCFRSSEPLSLIGYSCQPP